MVRPNFDTLYSSLAGPDERTDGGLGAGYRWPLLSVADARHVDRCFASPGWRTTGTKAETFDARQGWRPDLRDRLIDEFRLPKDTQRIEAPTPYVWIIGHTKTDGPADYDAVHKIQAAPEDHTTVPVG